MTEQRESEPAAGTTPAAGGGGAGVAGRRESTAGGSPAEPGRPCGARGRSGETASDGSAANSQCDAASATRNPNSGSTPDRRFRFKRRLTVALGTGGPSPDDGRDRTPLGWFARALRVPGRERRVLVQTAKATLAATGAWLLATLVLRLPQPFLAPYAAVFLVEATVYRSLRGWVQQVGSVATGVLLAAVAGQLIPWQAVALAVVVFAGLLAGSWWRFGESGVWVGVTGMLVVSYGTATEPVLLGDRLLETALGAAIGVAVNTLIFPPLYGERLVTAAGRVATALADLLEATSDLVRRDEPEGLDSLLSQANDARSQVQAAEDAAGLTREGRRLNLRRGRPGAGARHERPLRTLIALWPPLSQLVAAVRTTSARRQEHPFAYPWPDARDRLADLMHCLAGAVQSVATAGAPVELDECRALLHELEQRLVTAEDDGVPARLGLGAMILPARLLVEKLEDR